MDEMRLFLVSTADEVRVEVSGVVDAWTAPRMRAALRLLEQPGRPVLVDLTAVTAMDPTGVFAVGAAKARLARVGRELRVLAPEGSPARDALDRSRTGTYLQVA